MGFFSGQESSNFDMLKTFARKVAWKLLAFAIGWVGIYFLTHLFTEGVLMLLNLLVGCICGLVIGWTLAEDAVSDSGMTGLGLWVLLTFLACVPILVVELTLRPITGYPMDFGRWMCIASAIIMAMASGVWRASADE